MRIQYGLPDRIVSSLYLMLSSSGRNVIFANLTQKILQVNPGQQSERNTTQKTQRYVKSRTEYYAERLGWAP